MCITLTRMLLCFLRWQIIITRIVEKKITNGKNVHTYVFLIFCHLTLISRYENYTLYPTLKNIYFIYSIFYLCVHVFRSVGVFLSLTIMICAFHFVEIGVRVKMQLKIMQINVESSRNKLNDCSNYHHVAHSLFPLSYINTQTDISNWIHHGT